MVESTTQIENFKKVVTLIDFTDLCHKSVEFTRLFWKNSGCEISFVHVAPEGDEEFHQDILAQFNRYVNPLQKENIPFSLNVYYGGFEKIIGDVINTESPCLMIVGTHGIHGIRQARHGANILNLTQSVPCSVLVVQESSICSEEGFSKILLPITPHEQFNLKLKCSAAVAKLFNSKVRIYTVLKNVHGPGDQIESNKELAREFFETSGLEHEIIDQPPALYNYSLARYVLNHLQTGKSDLVTLMSQNGQFQSPYARTDKEKILTNQSGIPVLCIK